MRTITIQAQSHQYEVIVGKGLRHHMNAYLPKSYTSILIVTDEMVGKHYLKEVKDSLRDSAPVFSVTVPAGESSKSLAQYSRLLDVCIEQQLDRESLIIALGGGMIGDLAGFVAATYLRGIDFLQMPTSILAHDSSVGGKVAVNHKMGKNLIGSFYNPVKVIYDTETIRTLPDKEWRSGYGEVIKHALLSDAAWLIDLIGRKVGTQDADELLRDLSNGIKVKAGIVEEDERETGVRKHLNLGHTLAHAMEAELDYGTITHGEAVVIGTAFALYVSEKYFDSNLPTKHYVNWMKMNEYPYKLLSPLDPVNLVKRMEWDKKTVNRNIHYVLMREIGDPCVVHLSEDFLIKNLENFIHEVVKT